jgi:hypothetical protein
VGASGTSVWGIKVLVCRGFRYECEGAGVQWRLANMPSETNYQTSITRITKLKPLSPVHTHTHTHTTHTIYVYMKYIYIYIYMYVCVCVYIYIYKHTHTHTHTNTHTHTHTHTHT